MAYKYFNDSSSKVVVGKKVELKQKINQDGHNLKLLIILVWFH